MQFHTPFPSREQLLHGLTEAAELEHNLMCTYLYAAFSLRDGEAEGLSPEEAAAVAGWRRAILDIAIDEMGHLVAVWNIASALGGAPYLGRDNFPLSPGRLPANIVVKLAPFGEEVLQHFIHLERPHGSSERDGEGFAPELRFARGATGARLTPMSFDYETVGDFYAALERRLRDFVEHHGEEVAFCGDPALQLSPAEVTIEGARPVICIKTAAAALKTIVAQGEGAPESSEGSHYQRFIAVREGLAALKARNPRFAPAFPAARNPLLRRPVNPEGRVWIENDEASRTVDLANAAYALMLRLVAHAYAVPRPAPEKGVALDLSLGLMRAMTLIGERAARLPAGPSNPGCNAGMSFTAPRDPATLPPSVSAHRFFNERFAELASAANALAGADARMARAARLIGELAARAARGLDPARGPSPVPAPTPTPRREERAPPPTAIADGIERVEGEALTVVYEGRRCIHARHCVTWGPTVFLANVKGPWIHPDTMDAERLAEIAHVCPSGAIRYERKDGRPDESAPPVNLLAVREAGPYAVRADIRLDGETAHFRATLCRCGASKNKPFCDGSHHEIGFAASGEPASRETDMLPVRDGPLEIEPEANGPLRVRGNLEITSGTGRVVARLVQARLCRCGASATKPFCDNSHARIGFTTD
ncbi:MAG: CDGSH iron-sulfur domain-containing protein [Alphaproteobacteria bacterium]|nr:CDGSH iron-sulfur domain-containing protein [Alphaproteobacteria bacterium]